MANSAVTSTMADRLDELGRIAPSRLRTVPAPGTATVEDLTFANAGHKPHCELIDQSLVEKAMGFEASVVAAVILSILRQFVAARRLGIVSGADGLFELLPGTVRAPDVAFISRAQLRDGKFPTDAIPSLAPDLVVEVLSPGNTKSEMARKRVEYFHSGTRMIWIVDCVDRSVAVYTSTSAVQVFDEDDTIHCGDVLQGFSHPVAEFFADLDLGQQ